MQQNVFLILTFLHVILTLTWNQSMVQQFTREGNFRNLVRKASPIGLIARTMCSWFRTRSMKKLNRATGEPSVCLDFSRCLKKTSSEESYSELKYKKHDHKHNIKIILPIKRTHFFANLLFLVQCKKVWYLACIQKVIYVFEEWFLFNLKSKQLRNTSIIQTKPLKKLHW